MNRDYEDQVTTTEEAEQTEFQEQREPKKKKRKLKFWVLNLLFAIAGGVIGEMIAAITKNVSFLSWLSFRAELGVVEPLDINLIICHLKLGFYFVFNPALIIFIILALVIGNMVVSRRK